MHGNPKLKRGEPQALLIGWAMGCFWRWDFMALAMHGSILGQNFILQLHCRSGFQKLICINGGLRIEDSINQSINQSMQDFFPVTKCTPPRMGVALRFDWACAMVRHHPFHGVNLFSNRTTIHAMVGPLRQLTHQKSIVSYPDFNDTSTPMVLLDISLWFLIWKLHCPHQPRLEGVAHETDCGLGHFSCITWVPGVEPQTIWHRYCPLRIYIYRISIYIIYILGNLLPLCSTHRLAIWGHQALEEELFGEDNSPGEGWSDQDTGAPPF